MLPLLIKRKYLKRYATSKSDHSEVETFDVLECQLLFDFLVCLSRFQLNSRSASRQVNEANLTEEVLHERSPDSFL